MMKDIIFEKLMPASASKKGGISLDSMLEVMDRELENFTQLVQPAPSSSPRTPFDQPDGSTRSPSENMTTKQMLSLLPIMGPLMLGMKKSAKFYDGTFEPTRSEADPAFIAELEKVARQAGAVSISYVKVPPTGIFKEKGIPYENAIVFTVEMDKEKMDSAPSFDAFAEVAKGYKNLAVVSNKLTRMMRKAGFAAYPGTALGGLTDYPYLAELAGLGAIGYHGLLITPENGARLRINTIYTNITNLPIPDKDENEHLWIRDFCAMCKKCIRKCPVKAIYNEPKLRPDGGRQCIDHDSCRTYFENNHGCAICLVVCPFSQVGYDKVHDRFKGNPNAPEIRILLEPQHELTT
ncbi:MAG: reductive dehalogenase domain-containing protein [Ardenticatenaceae bacterium]|nr:reductive dehalogenase domain-containing protein [Ardenticatenaceae bacterium]